MGRGRAKAKQTKVARQLKYNSGGMDLDRLRDELVHDENGRVDGESDAANSTEVDDDDDPYAAYADEDDYADPYARYADEDDADPQRR